MRCWKEDIPRCRRSVYSTCTCIALHVWMHFVIIGGLCADGCRVNQLCQYSRGLPLAALRPRMERTFPLQNTAVLLAQCSLLENLERPHVFFQCPLAGAAESLLRAPEETRAQAPPSGTQQPLCPGCLLFLATLQFTLIPCPGVAAFH